MCPVTFRESLVGEKGQMGACITRSLAAVLNFSRDMPGVPVIETVLAEGSRGNQIRVVPRRKSLRP